MGFFGTWTLIRADLDVTTLDIVRAASGSKILIQGFVKEPPGCR